MTTLARSDTELSPQQPIIYQPPDPLAFIARAVERGAQADELSKLLDLHERVMKDQAQRAYTAAMRECQRLMPAILKDAQGQNSKYPKFENLLTDIKPIYTDQGFALSFSTADTSLADHYRMVCDVRHIGGHSERFHCDFPTDGKGAKGGASGMNAVQAVGSTMSYGRRYLTMMIFNLTIAGEDTDAARAQVATEKELVERAAKLAAIKLYIKDLDEAEEAACYAWMECQPDDLPWQKYDTILKGLKAKAAAKKKAVAT